MLNKNRSRLGVIVSSIISLVLLGAAGWVILNREYVVDQLNVWQYTPTPDVASIAERAALSDKGTFYFYASNPTIDNASAFNTHCERQESQTAILGCYASRQIYIFNVDNAQLDGIREVTAAHETLHAIWERMSPSQQESVGVLLEQAYSKINDPALDERMDYYARNQPGERSNELHSILGTEYANIGSELETHYREYFTDRGAVVDLHTKYQSVFNDLKYQADALLVEIQAQEVLLQQDIAAYDAEVAAIESDYAALLARQGSIDRTSQTEVDQYNSELDALRVRADRLSGTRQALLALQDAYNAKVTQYNTLVGASNSLAESLDSTLPPEPKL